MSGNWDWRSDSTDMNASRASRRVQASDSGYLVRRGWRALCRPFSQSYFEDQPLFVRNLVKGSTIETHREGTVDVEDKYFMVCELGHDEQLAKILYTRCGLSMKLRGFQRYLISLPSHLILICII